MHELPDLSKLSVAQKDTLIVALFEQVKELAATVQALSGWFASKRAATMRTRLGMSFTDRC